MGVAGWRIEGAKLSPGNIYQWLPSTLENWFSHLLRKLQKNPNGKCVWSLASFITLFKSINSNTKNNLPEWISQSSSWFIYYLITFSEFHLSTYITLVYLAMFTFSGFLLAELIPKAGFLFTSHYFIDCCNQDKVVMQAPVKE